MRQNKYQEKKKKAVWKYWPFWADQEESAWLNAMAKQGWHLKSFFLVRYVFERGEPANMVYQFDFRDRSTHELKDYIALCKEMGWDHVYEWNGWHCFRIDADRYEVQDLFTDYGALAAKYRRSLTYIGYLAMILVPVSLISWNLDLMLSSPLLLVFRLMQAGAVGTLLAAVWITHRRYQRAKTQAATQEGESIHWSGRR